MVVRPLLTLRGPARSGGFIKTLEVLEAGSVSRETGEPPVRDRRSTRLAVLTAAAAFCAARSEIKSGDVLVVAERWLAWVDQVAEG